MDAYTTALTLLSRRELSAKQLEDRLARRKFAREDIDHAIERLVRDRTVDDRRVALAYARMEASIKGRGKRRVLQSVQRLGVSPETAEAAVAEVFTDVDESTLFEKALARRLRGKAVRELDDKARARIVRHLVGQGFDVSRVLSALRADRLRG